MINRIRFDLTSISHLEVIVNIINNNLNGNKGISKWEHVFKYKINILRMNINNYFAIAFIRAFEK